MNPRHVGYGVVSFLALVFFFSCYTIIQPGYSGVMFNKWTGTLKTVGQGMALKIPFVTQVQAYPVALRTYTMVKRGTEGSSKEDDSIDLPTLEGQHIRQDFSVTYNTSADKASNVFNNFKGAEIEEIEATFIRRTIITVAQNAAGQMSLSEVISAKRGVLQSTIQANLGIELEKMGFFLDKVNMGASHLPEAIEQQMQQKMAAQQQAQQADYELQKTTTLAKAAVARASGEADSLLIQAKAQAAANALLQKTLTRELVQVKAIEKWNGSVPYISGGATPIIDLRGLSTGSKNNE